MHVLILGYSGIVKKRVLPALKKIKHIDCIDIASRSKYADLSGEAVSKGTFFNDYAEALAKSNADLVYISLVNSMHAEWAKRALLKGCHVIVDKPSFTSLDDAVRLATLARQKSLCLAEATVYASHPQIQLARELFLQAGTYPTRLSVSFSFPPFSEDNFRCQKHLGGGALLDLGSYAVSPGRLFFESQPEEVFCRIGTRHPVTDVDTSFSMLAIYPGGRSMVGHFDFNTEYRNRINILGPCMSVDIDRIFTTPPEVENELFVRSNNNAKTIKEPPANSFALFFQDVFDSIEQNKHQFFVENLLSDATAFDRLRVAAQEG
jgi:NDP-hexose-3-ketoreductase